MTIKIDPRICEHLNFGGRLYDYQNYPLSATQLHSIIFYIKY